MSRLKLVPVSDLFEVSYGTSLELNALEEDPDGVPFVSRTVRNNGVSARVKRTSVPPIPGGVLSVALSGSPMATFFQEEPFYSGYHVACLTPRKPMPRDLLLYYAACLRANRYRFSYGRQANRSLAKLLVPDLDDAPAWVIQRKPTELDALAADGLRASLDDPIDTHAWKPFKYTDLFEIKKGKRLTKGELLPGGTPYIGATESNNGVTARIGQAPLHPAGLITVSYNGSIGEAFFQPEPFWASDDVNVLYPRFEMPVDVALFLVALIRQEKYRYNYGRKWKLEVMRTSTVLLPVTPEGVPDFAVMRGIVKRLPAWKALLAVAPAATGANGLLSNC